MPTETGFVEVPGGRLYYEADGSGHPLLLIHGDLGSLRMWDAQVRAFADGYRVIRYDRRGYGRSETDDVQFSNRADAAAVLEHVGADSCHLIGHSRGAIIALDLALERPALIDSQVSVAGGIGGYQAELPDDVTRPPWDEMEQLWQAHDWERLAELETQVWVDGWGQPSTRVDSDMRRRVRGWILENYQASKAEGQPIPLQPPAVERLGELSLPLLVVLGTADEPGGVLASRRLAQAVSGARLAEFDGVAHMVHLEQPDRFNLLVLQFLAAVERGDA